MGTGYPELARQLMTPSLESLAKRIIRVDNITATYDRGLAQLITEPVISGHQMYTGDASRRNYFTVLGTINRESFVFDRDISTRSFIIELTKPDKNAAWERAYNMFFGGNPQNQRDGKLVRARQHKLRSSIFKRFQEPLAFSVEDISADHIRCQSFFFDVVARCCQSREQFLELIAYTRERIAACDYDVEIVEELLGRLAWLAKGTSSNGMRISISRNKRERVWITTEEVCDAYNDITKKNLDQVVVTQRIRSFCERRNLEELKYAGPPPGNMREQLGSKRGFWFDLQLYEAKEQARQSSDEQTGDLPPLPETPASNPPAANPVLSPVDGYAVRQSVGIAKESVDELNSRLDEVAERVYKLRRKLDGPKQRGKSGEKTKRDKPDTTILPPVPNVSETVSIPTPDDERLAEELKRIAGHNP